MASRRRGERLHHEVRSRIEELAKNEKWLSYRQIHARLRDEAASPGAKFQIGDVPDVRTVQNVARPHRGLDETDPWSISDAERPEDIPLILPVLAYVIDFSGAQQMTLTMREADLVVRVRTAAPQMPVNTVWSVIRDYITKPRTGQTDADIDAYLALAPWWSGPQSSPEFGEAHARYRRYLDNRAVKDRGGGYGPTVYGKARYAPLAPGEADEEYEQFREEFAGTKAQNLRKEGTDDAS